jgi:DNA mismatch repair protein MutS
LKEVAEQWKERIQQFWNIKEDEIGRGTSTYDGLSLAWAIVEQLNNETKCRTLVATHYHVLNKMQEKYNGITNYHVTAEEEEGGLKFYHKLMVGGINKSYGILVAKMAGISSSIIKNALIIQKALEEDSFLKSDMQNKINQDQSSMQPSPKNPRKINEQKEITDYKE